MKLSYQVNGLRMPARVGGHPGLDLCNTYAGWADPPGTPGRGDYLTGYLQLAQWAGEAGLLDPRHLPQLFRAAREHPRLAARALARTAALRTALYAVATEHPGTEAHTLGLALVADDAHTATARATLAPGKGWRAAPGLDEPLDASALAAVALLASVPTEEIGVCPGDGCGWLFHDPTRRRRWCRMEWCGNRLKQRAYAARSGQPARGPRRSVRS